MPEVTTCPKCDKKLKVPDNLIGKKVRCPGCEDTFTAKADGSADAGYEETEDEQEESPRAKAKAKAGSQRKDSISDRKGSPSRRDEDEDERPRSKKSRDADEDERPHKKSREDEEEDRPRAKKSRDEEEEDDRPRAKKSRDEDEDDRPRKKSRDEDDDRDRSRGVKRREDLDDRPSRSAREDDRPSRSRRDDDDRRPSRSRRDDDEDYDRRPSRSSSDSGWRGTRVGVFLMVISNWVLLAGFGVAFIGFGLMMFFGATMLSNLMGGGMGGDNRAGFGAMAGMGVMMIIFFGLLGILWFAYTVLQLVSMGLCMQVPPVRGTALKPMAIAAFACAAAALAISLINQFVLGNGTIESCCSLLKLASFICWIIFLRMVSNELGDSDLGSKFLIYMITYFVFVVVAVMVVIVAACSGGAALMGSRDAEQAATGAGVMMVVMMILGAIILAVYLGLVVWYSLLLQRLRGVITRHLERG